MGKSKKDLVVSGGVINFNYKDTYCKMKELIRHILREHNKEVIEASGIRLTNDDFIKKAREIHGGEYDYSKINYVNNRTPILIICKEHGEFPQIPGNHLKGYGCPKCAGNYRYTNDEFLKRLKEIYGDKYDFTNSKYVNWNTKINFKCKKHGKFLQWPGHLLKGTACPECGIELNAEQRRKPVEDFILAAKEIHGEKYDYSQVDYKSSHTPVSIICPTHGEFFQSPNAHVGQKQGCPYCKESKGERLVGSILEKNKLKFIRQKKFEDCTNNINGRYCKKLPFDFYLKDKNTCIEYDGRQHYEPVSAFGGDEGFKKVKILDKIKNQYCKKNGIKLIRIPYTMKKEEIEPYILKELNLT